MRADKKGLYLVISPKVTSIEDTPKGSKVKVNPYHLVGVSKMSLLKNQGLIMRVQGYADFFLDMLNVTY